MDRVRYDLGNIRSNVQNVLKHAWVRLICGVGLDGTALDLSRSIVGVSFQLLEGLAVLALDIGICIGIVI